MAEPPTLSRNTVQPRTVESSDGGGERVAEGTPKASNAAPDSGTRPVESDGYALFDGHPVAMDAEGSDGFGLQLTAPEDLTLGLTERAEAPPTRNPDADRLHGVKARAFAAQSPELAESAVLERANFAEAREGDTWQTMVAEHFGRFGPINDRQVKLYATLVARANGGSVHAPPEAGQMVALPQTEQLAHQLWSLNRALAESRVSPAAARGGQPTAIAAEGDVYEPSLNDNLGTLAGTAFGEYIRANATGPDGVLDADKVTMWSRAVMFQIAEHNELDSAWVGNYEAVELPTLEKVRSAIENPDGTLRDNPLLEDRAMEVDRLASGINAIDMMSLLDSDLSARVGPTVQEVRAGMGEASRNLLKMSRDEWLADLDAGPAPPVEFGGLGLAMLPWIEKMPPRVPAGEASYRYSDEPRDAYLRRAAPHLELFDPSLVAHGVQQDLLGPFGVSERVDRAVLGMFPANHLETSGCGDEPVADTSPVLMLDIEVGHSAAGTLEHLTVEQLQHIFGHQSHSLGLDPAQLSEAGGRFSSAHELYGFFVENAEAQGVSLSHEHMAAAASVLDESGQEREAMEEKLGRGEMHRRVTRKTKYKSPRIRRKKQSVYESFARNARVMEQQRAKATAEVRQAGVASVIGDLVLGDGAQRATRARREGVTLSAAALQDREAIRERQRATERTEQDGRASVGEQQEEAVREVSELAEAESEYLSSDPRAPRRRPKG